MKEINLNLDCIKKKDLEDVLSQVRSGDEFALRIIEKNAKCSEVDNLEEIFLEIVNKAKLVVLIASPTFEVLLRNADPLKVKFVEDEGYDPDIAIPALIEDVIEGMVENFWAFHFPSMLAAKNLSKGPLYCHAMVELEDKNIQYILMFGFDLSGLKCSVEKILQYSVEDFEMELKDLSSEVLNLMCGKLRPVLKRTNIEAKIGIPAVVEDENNWAQKCTKLRSWNYQLAQGASVEIKLYKWVGHV